jgi:transposase-like protein
MIKLSDVKVATQYRERVRHRLVILAYAGSHGSTAAGRRYGVSARTIRRWRKRWQADGLKGLVPRYPRRHQRRVTGEVLELIPSYPPGARVRRRLDAPVAAPPAPRPAHHGDPPADLRRSRVALPASHPEADPASASPLREARASEHSVDVLERST